MANGTGSTVVVSATVFDQHVVDSCKAHKVKDSSDLNALFAPQGGFYPWYNTTLSGSQSFAHRGPASLSPTVQSHFNAFWDQIPTVFATPSVSAIEFCALMSISIQETTGDLAASPEEMNGLHHPHPGLAYAFDKIPGLKQSYNHAPNRTALSLFSDANFLSAHGTLPGASAILNKPGGIDAAWGGDTWPTAVPANVDQTINGFVMQADFFKFRGRGVIQTTWRFDYSLLIKFVLSSANPVLQQLAIKWNAPAGAGPIGDPNIDAIATLSSDDDWNIAFGQAETLAAGVALDSAGKGKYLDLSDQEPILSGDAKTPGSLLHMAAKINGGNYPATVVPMMKAMMCAVAAL